MAHMALPFRPVLRPVLRSPLVRGSGGGFSPAKLFAAGEQGGWYDPSDLSSMYQESAGTTPVTATGQPVGFLVDKRMSLGSELSPDPNFASSTGWSTSGANAVYSAGVWTITSAGGLEYISRQINAAKTANRWYKITIQVTAATSLVATVLRLYMATTAGGLTSSSSFPAISAPGSYSIFVLCAVANPFFTLMVTAGGASVSVSSMTVKDADANHLIQATAASRPVLQQDGSGFYYMAFDGVDDFLISSSLSISAVVMAAAVQFTAGSAGSSGNIFDGTTTRQLFGGDAGSTYRMFAGTVLASAGIRDAANHVLMAFFAGASSSLELDKAVVASGAAGAQTITGGIHMGSSDTGGGQLLNGKIYGSLLINRSLSAGEKTGLYTYLGAKVGLPL